MLLQATRGTRYTLVFCIIMIAGYVVKVLLPTTVISYAAPLIAA